MSNFSRIRIVVGLVALFDRQTAEIQTRIAIMNSYSAVGRAEIEAVA